MEKARDHAPDSAGIQAKTQVPRNLFFTSISISLQRIVGASFTKTAEPGGLTGSLDNPLPATVFIIEAPTDNP
jgi:hypothetical protein